MNLQTKNLMTPVIVVVAGIIAFMLFQPLTGVPGSTDAGQIQMPAPPVQNADQDREINLTTISFEYGTLVFNKLESTYRFTVGDVQIPQTGSTKLENLVRSLGGKLGPRTNFGSLLNTIGAQGWELIDAEENDARKSWLFKRAY